MSEVGEMWRELHDEERIKRQKNFEENMALLRASTVPFKFLPEANVVLIRDRGYPAVDFYPHTGRWKIGNRKQMGGAAELLRQLVLRDSVRR